jgi:hypothetical protein
MRYSDKVSISRECSEIVCLKSKNTLPAGYYVVPQILHWEDRATQWSGRPDQIEIKITVYDAETSNIVASTRISGESKWATLGGDHPEDLLAEPVGAYISSLY